MSTESNFPFTDAQLSEMRKRPFPSSLWHKAFEIYNSDKSNTRKLSMSCRSCYQKVMQYLLERNEFILKKQIEDLTK